MIIFIFASLMMTITSMIFMPKNKHNWMKLMSLFFSFINMWMALMSWNHLKLNSSFQFNLTEKWMDINPILTKWGPLHFGMDEMSAPFMILTTLLIPVTMLMSWNSMKFMVKEFMLCLFMIHLLLMGVFTSLNMLIFYMLFEIMLIPMFLMMGIWGSSKEKESAAFYFFFYTLVGSLFMLLAMFKLYNFSGSLDYQTLVQLQIPKNLQMWMFLGFFLSLAMKMPKVPFHMWLPQAHVEAPVAGSVLLAGMLLKLGGYGFISFSWNLFPFASSYFSPLIMILSSLAVMYASLSTCSQTDAKSLVAYSSVAHMGMVTMAIFSGTLEGMMASMLLMVAHGLVSSSLFMLVTNLYDSFHTSLMSYYSGLSFLMPLFATFLFLFMLANIAFPISLNFVAEFLSMISAMQYHWMVMIPLLMGMVLSASYSLSFFNSMSFGNPSKFLLMSSDLTSQEFNSFLPLLLPTMFLGLSPISLIHSFNFPFML